MGAGSGSRLFEPGEETRRPAGEVCMDTLKEPRQITATRHAPAVGASRGRDKIVRFVVLVDAVVLAAAAAIGGLVGGVSAVGFAWWIPTAVLASLVAFSFYRLYERDRSQIVVSTLDEWRDFLNALTLFSFVALVVNRTVHLEAGFPAAAIVIFWLTALLLLPIGRAILRHLVFPRIAARPKTIIVGAGHVGQMVASKLLKRSGYNVELIGFLDDEPHVMDPRLAHLPVLGGERDLIETIVNHQVSRVILAFSRRPVDQLLEVIRSSGLQEIQLSIVPRYFEIMAANVDVVDVDGIPIVEVPAPRLSRASRATKRSFDLALTIPGLIVLAPVFFIVSAAIKLDSPGPVFFRQPRMGRENRVFEILKFRTMCDGAEELRDGLLDQNESSGPLFKIRQDPRVTRVGVWLRRLSLDELPQLLNVLRGEMSLVGPRPFVVYEDKKIDGWARRRLDLTPGMTGLWQVLGRNDIGFQEMVKLDYLYVNNWSVWGDIKLLLRTVPVVFTRRGY
jgi:exopolysaccharide biosynthesis polyprenyl glycosylphosphotransferase